MARTDLWFGGPLHRQQPNPPPAYPKARVYGKSPFQERFPIRYYPHFREAIPDLRASYRRVTEPYASIAGILAWLSRIPIAAIPRRINGN
jgi:hypothetical protein